MLSSCFGMFSWKFMSMMTLHSISTDLSFSVTKSFEVAFPFRISVFQETCVPHVPGLGSESQGHQEKIVRLKIHLFWERVYFTWLHPLYTKMWPNWHLGPFALSHSIRLGHFKSHYASEHCHQKVRKYVRHTYATGVWPCKQLQVWLHSCTF